jgi:hypothetical protein
MVEYRVGADNNKWIESEFNPAQLELARMSELLNALDKVMVHVNTGNTTNLRLCYALEIQIFNYFKDRLPKPHREIINKICYDTKCMLYRVLNLINSGHPNHRMEEILIDKLTHLTSLIYQYKGMLNLGITFRSKMTSEDILNNALGITKAEIEGDDEKGLSEDDVEEVIKEDEEDKKFTNTLRELTKEELAEIGEEDGTTDTETEDKTEEV